MATVSPTIVEAAPGTGHRRSGRSGTGLLALGALGVVYGDVGTSPLYALQAIFTGNDHPVPVTQAHVYGVVSLVFWSLTLIVSVKYIGFVMRADDHGEGGIMSLTSLVRDARTKRARTTVVLVTLGIIGASLFYGDGVITPAISVLSAVSGLDVAVPGLASLVIPVTLSVLVVLFAVQRFGTGFVGNLFGPVMILWFAALAAMGIVEIARGPGILRALDPIWAARFVASDPTLAFFSLGGVVLCLTGSEALYADMGHFGRRPIQLAWYGLVFPALVLNYFGQGALLLRHPRDASNPFFYLFPSWAQIPMVILATIATVIASQAVISGAYSVSQQAVQLGFLPRLHLRHTSSKHHGQIYVPAVNAILFVAVVLIVLGFKTSNNLASAYGIAVTGTFVLNSILFLAVARLRWHVRMRWIVLGGAVILPVEVLFFAANTVKIVSGGWLPLVIALIVVTLLKTWASGRRIVTRNRDNAEGLLADFIERLSAERQEIQVVPGVAVFLTPNLRTTPLALQANVRYNRVLHDHVLIVRVVTERVPHVPPGERMTAEPRVLFSGATGDPVGELAERISLFTLHFGYRDEPDVPAAILEGARRGLIPGDPDMSTATYFLSQITIMPIRAPGLSRWRKALFVTIARNAANPATYFRLPDSRTVISSGRIAL